MAGYNYAGFVSDFSIRTLENIKKIDKMKEEALLAGCSEDILQEEHHEVTQLINSLLGMLVVPYEKYKFNHDSINSTRENELKSISEYGKLVDFIVNLEKRGKLYNSYESDTFVVSCFLKHIRNSVCHSGNNGLFFSPINKKKKVEKILFYDHDGNEEFCAELSIGQLRQLLQLVAQMYQKVEEQSTNDDLKIYNGKVDSYKELLKKSSRWAQKYVQ